MSTSRILSYALCCLGLGACDSAAPEQQQPAQQQPAPAPGLPSVGTYQAGLEDTGAIALPLTDQRKQRVEISAPITPRTEVLYAAEGGNYPASATDEAALGDQASLTFDYLLAHCAQYYAEISMPQAGASLNTGQIRRNYDLIAQCAYEKFTAKPYWIPKLVDDLDLCGRELGADWRLLAEQDFSGLADGDFDFINAAVTGTAGSLPGGQSFGGYYFTLLSYVRGANGALKLGDLSSGVKVRLSDLNLPPGADKFHLENGGNPVTLRCLRRRAP